MQLRKTISICLLIFFSFGEGIVFAKDPEMKSAKLTEQQTKIVCGLNFDMTSGTGYIDELTNIILENSRDQNAVMRSRAFSSATGRDLFGENIYVKAYLKIAKEPYEKAIESVAKTLGVNEKDAFTIMNGGVDIIAKKKNYLTLEEALNEQERLKNLYNEVLDLTKLETEVKGYLEPMQIYSDGDTENSGGFDLLYDFDLIDYLLFYDKANISLGADLNFLKENNTAKKEAEEESKEAMNKKNESSPKNTESPKTPSSASPEKETPPPSPSSGKQNEKFNEKISNKDARLSCFADSNLENDIDRLLKENEGKIDKEEKIQQEYQEELKNNVEKALQENKSIEYVEKPLSPPETPDVIEDQAKDKNNPFCNEWICFEVNLSMKKQSLFGDKANCIACHFDKIKEVMQKTVSKNLIPNKLTGNLMEPAKCKKAAGLAALSINIFTIFNPIKTPPNTNKVGTENMVSFGRLLESALGSTYYDTTQNKFLSKKTAMQESALKTLPLESNLSVTEAEISRALSQAEGEAAQQFKNIVSSNELYNKAGDFYQAINRELGYMHAYFKAMNLSFEDINATFCPNMLNKPKCQ